MITPLPRLAFKIVSDAGIAGVLQIGDHKTNRTCASSTKPSCHGVRVVIVLTHHSHDFFNGFVAHTVLLRFAVNNIACSGPRHSRQPSDFIQFHNCPLRKM
ncbi:Uncharacterised protein [Shigella sonnei]|nr:Uncharacterised protein [Shigella sonnei]